MSERTKLAFNFDFVRSVIFSHDRRRKSGFSVICLFRKTSSVFSCNSYFVIGPLVDIFGENGRDVFIFEDFTLNSFLSFFF